MHAGRSRVTRRLSPNTAAVGGEQGTRIDYSVVGKTANLVVNTMWVKDGVEILSSYLETGEFENREADVEKALVRLSDHALRLQSQGIWHPITHDRRVELVFIGDADLMDAERIRNAIQNALLTDEELDCFTRGELTTPEALVDPFAEVPRCIRI